MRLQSAIILTYLSLLTEQLFRKFWPFFSLSITLLGMTFLGVQNNLGQESLWFWTFLSAFSIGLSFLWCLWGFRLPSWSHAKKRLDRSLPSRPLQGLSDKPLLEESDTDSKIFWTLHQRQLLLELSSAKALKPDLNLMQRDRFGLRFSALLVFFLSVLFGAIPNLRTSIGLQVSKAPEGMVTPQWEGWITPPAYSALPILYLNDLKKKSELSLLKDSKIEARMYGASGTHLLSETVSTGRGDLRASSELEQIFEVQQAGEIIISGPQDASWFVQITPDTPPEVSWDGTFETDFYGESEFLFSARDDFGVVGGSVRIELDLIKVDRRFGLLPMPRFQNPILLDLPMPVSGNRRDFDSKFIEDFSASVWANLPVKILFNVEDALSQSTESAPVFTSLPGRRFFDPLAGALIEQRRDLLWSDENAKRVYNILRAISQEREKVFRKETDYLRLKFVINELERFMEGGSPDELRDELAKALWDLALSIEEGDVDTALERMRRAQQRLTQAMKGEVSDQEIAELMQELQLANSDYLRQLARKNAKNQDQNEGQKYDGEGINLSQNYLQEMMDRIKKFMEQGRMAEAQHALEELQNMIKNLRVAQLQNGNGSPSEQSVENLTDTLREQQQLSDDAFQNLQREFNKSHNNQGQSKQGQSQEGQTGKNQSENKQTGGENRESSELAPSPDEDDLAFRQGELEEQLQDQQNELPKLNGSDGADTKQSLKDAQDAMRSAKEALENGDLADALDYQSKAMDSLREGIRDLSRSLTQNNQRSKQLGEGKSFQRDGQTNDPLGRASGAGVSNVDQGMQTERWQAERVKELLEEIRRRSGDRQRSEDELNYLKKLLEKF